jgi:predicted esterase
VVPLVTAFFCRGDGTAAGAVAPGTRPPVSISQTLQLIEDQPMVADWPVFFGPAFPNIDFLNRDLVVAAVGDYQLIIRHFDGKWNEVAAPVSPGRYGALVEIRFANGAVATRRITLFKAPHTYVPAKDPYRVLVTLPAPLGLPADTLRREQWNISNFVSDTLDETYNSYSNDAVLIAALADLAADPARWHGFSSWKINRDWWAGLSDKLGTLRGYPRVVALPAGYDLLPAARWPLILFLHGSGNRGDDLARVKDEGPLAYAKEGHLPFIIAVPLCPAGEQWQALLLARLLDELEAKYRIDPRRIYVTGVSMGGFGTFDFAASYPDRVAAIAPIAGGENPAIAERLKHIPAWIFHGGEDSAVPARYSVDIANEMKRIGAPVVLSLYPTWGHGGWTGSRWGRVPYREPDLYAWFLRYSRP